MPGGKSPGRKPRVALIFGGRSSEHGVSCSTAGSVLRALDRERYDIIPIGITVDGRWVLEKDEPERLAIQSDQLPEVDEKGTAVVLASDPGAALVSLDPTAVPGTLGEVDVVFPLLHGPFGEDGTLQGLLEMAGVRYVGAGVLASAVAMDKHYAKLVFQAHGFPVTPYTVIKPGAWERDRAACEESVASLGYPVFVKPARGGSSIGITKVSKPGELVAAVEKAQQFDPKVLVEASAGKAREIECGVLEGLDGGRPEASAVAEIRYDTSYDFYDFEAKYLDDEEHVDLQLPANLSEDVTRRVREMAVTAFEAISAEGLARVDFFLAEDGTLLLNEINTMPGFTPYSMFPRMWAATGLDYPALVDRLIQLALRRPTGLR
ncbi:D-alanine--D-alanine ligase family protein [Actinopolymorpha alba]|uniref:D-alanine--D-alanine ligase family protein n=1 Tax=Actinopolymorpha alba TaxID=533267 RepID=UPI00047832CF|nr:D-alanine--D-alanine ligase family protein [Actinopolymorpha alba]